MKKNLLFLMYITILSIFIHSSAYATQGINGGDECSGSRGRSPFCCTINHSGSRGDCGDVVINNLEKKCTFLEDINQCQKLPNNWERAKEDSTWGRVCPSMDYQWIEGNLSCDTLIADKNIENNLEDTDYKTVAIVTALFILVVIGGFFLKKK